MPWFEFANHHLKLIVLFHVPGESGRELKSERFLQVKVQDNTVERCSSYVRAAQRWLLLQSGPESSRYWSRRWTCWCSLVSIPETRQSGPYCQWQLYLSPLSRPWLWPEARNLETRLLAWDYNHHPSQALSSTLFLCLQRNQKLLAPKFVVSGKVSEP